MFHRLGQSLFFQAAYAENSILVNDLSLSTALPSGFSYTRSDAVSMYRDSDGDWQVASANEALFDHDESGNPLGLRFDQPATNKCENVNWGMTDLTGVTVSGGSGGVGVSISTHPVHGFPTLLIDNTGGTSTMYVTIAGAVGNTNPHSASAYIHIENKVGNFAFIQESDGFPSQQGDGSIAAGTDFRLALENYTPGTTGRTMRIGSINGAKMHVFLNQLEENEIATPPIYVNGSSASRTSARLWSSDIETDVPAFNLNAGTIVADATPYGTELENDGSQYFFSVNDGNEDRDGIGIYMRVGQNNQIRGSFRSNYASYQNSDVARPISNHRWPVAITWGGGSSTVLAPNMRYEDEAYSALPQTPINSFNIGSGSSSSGEFAGHIRSLKVYNQKRTVAQLAADMFDGQSLYSFVNTGQSNAEYMFNSRSNTTGATLRNAGERNVVEQMEFYNSSYENWFIDAASGGSSVNKDGAGGGDNYWYDEDTDSDGPLLTRFKERTTAFGVANIHAIHWDQGETNVSLSTADYEMYAQEVFDRMRAHVGDVPVVITKLGRRGAEIGDSYNNIREAQRNLIADNSWCHEAPTKITRELIDDGVHLSDDGFGEHGEVLGRKLLSVAGVSAGSNSIDGAYISNVVRSGTTVTVTLTHDQENDFDPTTGIEGFRFEDDGVQIAITNAVRTDGSTITLTLDSEPTGTEELWYGYGSVYDDITDRANLVVEDAGNDVPLQTYYGEL